MQDMIIKWPTQQKGPFHYLQLSQTSYIELKN